MAARSDDQRTRLLTVQAEYIPDELKARPQWVVWEAELNANGKLDKIPYDPRSGRRASTTNPRQWATFDEAFAEYQIHADWDGVGYVFIQDDPYVGIDLDKCHNMETGKLTSGDARNIVKSVNSYTEVSPSGTGVKIIVRATLDRARIDHDQGIEIYAQARFFTLTGHPLASRLTEIRTNQDALDTLLTRFPERTESQDHHEYQAKRVPTDELISRATAAKNGERFWRLWRGEWYAIKPSQSEADAALCAMLAFWTGPDREWIDDLFRESDLYREEKWERHDYRQHTIDLALDGLTEWYEWHRPTANMNGHRKTEEAGAITLADFRAYMPDHKYIFIPSRELWPASSVNARLKSIDVGTDDEGKPIKIAANKWLDEHQPVEQMTWAPGEPELVEGRLMSQGGWVERSGCTVFNRYRPPTIVHGDPTNADMWIEHVHYVYPEHAAHIIRWFAHRVQHPAIKINHALVLGGAQGVGKDTILEPVKQAVGAWNFYEVTPTQLLGRFNSFVQSVILRVSEARDLGDGERGGGTDRYTFYEHLKSYAAAPPDVLLCDEKFVRAYNVLNVCGVVITTNHLSGGLYLPADDRRHFVAWSERTINDFGESYWSSLYDWYETGGFTHVAAYLATLDIADFDPKAPPEKTSAFWDIVTSNLAPEDAELSDILDQLSWPHATTISEIASKADINLSNWLLDRRNSRQMPHRMEEVGYIRVRNSAARDGLWKTGGKRQTVFAKKELDPRQRIAAARELVGLYK